MTRHVIHDGATTYTRITRREAKRRWENKEPFYIIAHKMRPGAPFHMGMTIDSTEAHKDNEYARKFDADWKAKYPESTHTFTLHTFESCVNDFCWYNANCHETGLYAAFYDMRVKEVKA